MKRYTLVVKAGTHASGWGLIGWMREKLSGYDWTQPPSDPDVVLGKKPATMPDEWVVYVDTTDDLTDRLNAWFCEPGKAPFSGGTLLYWTVKAK